MKVTMKIEMDFVEDIRLGMEAQLRELGYTPRPATGVKYRDAHGVCMDHTHAMARRIPASRRIVRVSDELTHREPSLPVAIRGGILSVAYDLMFGHDLTPRLSRGLKKRDARDELLWDWGIHHLHLGAQLQNDGFTVRTDDLLFVMVRANAAYLIDVRPHGAWADEELVEIVHMNWPQEISRFRLRIILDGNVTPEQRQLLRRRGLNSAFRTKDGTTYGMMGGGITSSRESAGAVIDSDRLLSEAQNVEAFIRDRAQWLADLVIENIGCEPQQVRLQLLELVPGRAAGILVRNEVRDFAFRLPYAVPDNQQVAW